MEETILMLSYQSMQLGFPQRPLGAQNTLFGIQILLFVQVFVISFRYGFQSSPYSSRRRFLCRLRKLYAIVIEPSWLFVVWKSALCIVHYSLFFSNNHLV